MKKGTQKKYILPDISRNCTIGAISSEGDSWFLNFEKDVNTQDVDYFMNELFRTLDKRKRYFVTFDVIHSHFL